MRYSRRVKVSTFCSHGHDDYHGTSEYLTSQRQAKAPTYNPKDRPSQWTSTPFHQKPMVDEVLDFTLLYLPEPSIIHKRFVSVVAALPRHRSVSAILDASGGAI